MTTYLRENDGRVLIEATKIDEEYTELRVVEYGPHGLLPLMVEVIGRKGLHPATTVMGIREIKLCVRHGKLIPIDEEDIRVRCAALTAQKEKREAELELVKQKEREEAREKAILSIAESIASIADKIGTHLEAMKSFTEAVESVKTMVEKVDNKVPKGKGE